MIKTAYNTSCFLIHWTNALFLKFYFKMEIVTCFTCCCPVSSPSAFTKPEGSMYLLLLFCSRANRYCRCSHIVFGSYSVGVLDTQTRLNFAKNIFKLKRKKKKKKKHSRDPSVQTIISQHKVLHHYLNVYN